MLLSLICLFLITGLDRIVLSFFLSVFLGAASLPFVVLLLVWSWAFGNRIRLLGSALCSGLTLGLWWWCLDLPQIEETANSTIYRPDFPLDWSELVPMFIAGTMVFTTIALAYWKFIGKDFDNAY